MRETPVFTKLFICEYFSKYLKLLKIRQLKSYFYFINSFYFPSEKML